MRSTAAHDDTSYAGATLENRVGHRSGHRRRAGDLAGACFAGAGSGGGNGHGRKLPAGAGRAERAGRAGYRGCCRAGGAGRGAAADPAAVYRRGNPRRYRIGQRASAGAEEPGGDRSCGRSNRSGDYDGAAADHAGGGCAADQRRAGDPPRAAHRGAGPGADRDGRRDRAIPRRWPSSMCMSIRTRRISCCTAACRSR
jgi:hypothetical protein